MKKQNWIVDNSMKIRKDNNINQIIIADCGQSEILSTQQMRENAYLIAAAPDLLFYAEKVMDLLKEHGGAIVPHLMDSDENDGEMLRQAIIKAKTF